MPRGLPLEIWSHVAPSSVDRQTARGEDAWGRPSMNTVALQAQAGGARPSPSDRHDADCVTYREEP
jgi:hypothetical protein